MQSLELQSFDVGNSWQDTYIKTSFTLRGTIPQLGDKSVVSQTFHAS